MNAPSPRPSAAAPPTIGELLRVYGRIGLLSFGGPAGQISLMHRELVETRPWLSEQQFMGALSFCMFLPGPEAMQLATYSGWKLRGTVGGLIAGLLFVLPGALVILALASLYVQFGTVPLVQQAFLGIKAAVVVIVLQALLRMSRKALTSPLHWVLAGAAFVGIYVFDLPFPLLIAVAAILGAQFFAASNEQNTPVKRPPPPYRAIAIWGALWLAPLVFYWAINAQFLLQVGLFFSKLAMVTFGGAYAVLAYMSQAAVGDFGWLSTPQMIDALGLAETTPGPLILVTEFVGFLAGQAQGGYGLALLAALTTLWVTFVPCFLWIFAGAPYVDLIMAQPRFQGALAAITAAVTGVILNLSLWFMLNVLFTHTGENAPLAPVQGLNPAALILIALAAAFLLGARLSIVTTLVLMACAGIGVAWI